MLLMPDAPVAPEVLPPIPRAPMSLAAMDAWLRQHCPQGPAIATLRRHAASGRLRGARARPQPGAVRTLYDLGRVLDHYGLLPPASSSQEKAATATADGAPASFPAGPGAASGVAPGTVPGAAAPDSAPGPAPNPVPSPVALQEFHDLRAMVQALQTGIERLSSTVGALSQQVQEQARVLDGALESMGGLQGTARDLVALRSTLMLKYDAAAQSQAQRIVMLEEALKKGGGAAAQQDADMTLPLMRIERNVQQLAQQVQALRDAAP